MTKLNTNEGKDVMEFKSFSEAVKYPLIVGFILWLVVLGVSWDIVAGHPLRMLLALVVSEGLMYGAVGFLWITAGK